MDVIVRSALGLERDEHETFLADVIAGLTDNPKRLGAKYFYDAEGSRLFEEITGLPEYYPTRTEMGILRRARRWSSSAAARPPRCACCSMPRRSSRPMCRSTFRPSSSAPRRRACRT